MASSSSSSFMGLLVVLVVAALLQCATAVTYTVGDTTGWTIPSGGAQFYSNWAGGKTFVVGDILSFNFVPQSHDVATVTKAQNDACTSEGNIIRTSPANITLSTAGNHYFICTFSGHCAAGQKLTINVVSSSTATPATPPTVSADGPSPPPTSGDSTFPNDAPSLFTGFGTAGGNGNEDNKKRIIVIGISTGAGCFLLAGFLFLLIRTNSSGWSRRNWKKKTNNAGDGRDVEEFLEIYGSLALRRYTYSDLKKITNSFKDSLGQGGYGGVFKGMLQDGRLVAVKVLNESKGNGEDFINEVSSIGRTYHVNIVSLLGFCSEGSKRALIYEFMPNGSLEKFIYTDKPGQSHPLGWEKLYQIAIGVARGLEYLHRGCNTRILHFDIKPHNILLDQDFCPKISDFGLAKLCPMQNSSISMLGARGTFGFIAPEVYCRNIGGVSNKSDVYSYGMMVLEMVGGRKNIDPLVENTSEIYFPHWIYKRLTTYRHLDQDGYLGLHGIATKVEEETARKMILVGLWCIQTNPTDRPSMSRVVEMLEGSLDDLQMPPQPFLSSSS